MKKKYIYLIGILVVICLVIFVVLYNKGDSVKVYDKYSARIGIMYDGVSYSRSFDYDGSVGRVIYDDGTVYMDSKGMYYALDGGYYRYDTNVSYVNLGDIVSKFKIDESGDGYRCEASPEFLKSLFIKGEANDCYLSVSDGYVTGVSVNFDKGNVYISFKRLADDFSVSMLGYFDEKSSAVHDNILEIK